MKGCEQYSSDVYLAFDKSADVDELPDELAKIDFKGVVVDIGSGPGTYLDDIKPSWDDYIGIEPSRFLIQVAEEKSRNLGINCRFIKAKAQNIPLEDNSADTIISIHALNETGPEGIKEAMKEILRIGKSGAQVIICDLIGGDSDGWYEVLARAAIARGNMPTREMADIWTEIFRSLAANTEIVEAKKLDLQYHFKDTDDAVDKIRALVPDVMDNPDVNKAMRNFFKQPEMKTHALLIKATINN